MQSSNNVDLNEIDKFSRIASEWWDRDGKFKTLHDINPLRLSFIQQYLPLNQKKVIDVGCGGGILSEGMARWGANVTGIDLASASLAVARLHAKQEQLEINYQEIPAETLAEAQPDSFDGVVCMEMLEHVPDPQSIINACAKLAKPNAPVFFSTLNRNRTSFLHAIVAAEYMLRMMPKGTHEFQKFIQPAELARMCRHANLEVVQLMGMGYQPLTKSYFLTSNTQVNYLMCCRKI